MDMDKEPTAKPKLLTTKELKALRANSECYLCSNKDDLVVDHDHNTHHIRHVLCRTCNGAYILAGIENRLNTLANRAGISLSEAIGMIQEYLTDDYSMNDYYINMLSIKAKKFARLNATEQRETLKALNVNTSTTNALTNGNQRLIAYKTALKQQYKRQ